jgi:hypothetical protein
VIRRPFWWGSSLLKSKEGLYKAKSEEILNYNGKILLDWIRLISQTGVEIKFC